MRPGIQLPQPGAGTGMPGQARRQPRPVLRAYQGPLIRLETYGQGQWVICPRAQKGPTGLCPALGPVGQPVR
jgi:hypothetical protein